MTNKSSPTTYVAIHCSKLQIHSMKLNQFDKEWLYTYNFLLAMISSLPNINTELYNWSICCHSYCWLGEILEQPWSIFVRTCHKKYENINYENIKSSIDNVAILFHISRDNVSKYNKNQYRLLTCSDSKWILLFIIDCCP